MRTCIDLTQVAANDSKRYEKTPATRLSAGSRDKWNGTRLCGRHRHGKYPDKPSHAVTEGEALSSAKTSYKIIYGAPP